MEDNSTDLDLVNVDHPKGCLSDLDLANAQNKKAVSSDLENMEDYSIDPNLVNSQTAKGKLTDPAIEHCDDFVVNDMHDLASIKLPPKIKKRGRPKGAGLTVIGLPRKKHCKDKPVKFLKKGKQEREKQILDWMLPDDLVAKAQQGYSLEAKELGDDLFFLLIY